MKALEWSQYFSLFKSLGMSRRSRAANPEVRDLIWPNFEPIQDFMVAHVTCKNEEDPIKTSSPMGNDR